LGFLINEENEGRYVTWCR